MVDVGQTIDVLLKLNFRSLSDDWVKNTWDQDFTVCDDLPVEVEEDLQATNFHLAELRSAAAVLKKWVGFQAEEGQGFWKVLGDNDLSHKGLVAFLYYFMVQGQKRTSNAVHRETGILAANIYFTILRIPGSGAFKIFHPMLFEKSVTTFKTWSLLDAEPVGRKRKAVSPVRSSQSKKRGRRKANETQNPFGNESESENEEEEDMDCLTSKEINILYKCYMKLLRDFVSLLESYTLRSSEQSVQVAIQAMVDMAKMDPETFHGKFEDNINVENMHSVPQLAYHGLLYLACGTHGDVTMCSTAVFKYLMPVILMMIGDNKAIAAQTIPRSIQNSKDNAVKFVCCLIEKNENVLPSVRILLQHMCMKVPDKAEYRGKVGQAIIVILNKLPPTSFARMMEWIHTFSRTAKIGHRVFGLDIVCLLLEAPERPVDAIIPEEYQVYATQSFYIQMLLSRCSDIASTVRARAIVGFAQCSASAEPLIKDTIRQIVTPRAMNRPPISRVVPTPEAQRTAPAVQEQGEKDSETNKLAENSDKEATDAESAEGNEQEKTHVGDKTNTEENRMAVNATNIRLSLGKTPGMTIRYDAEGTPIVSIQLTPGNEITLADGKGVMSLLRRRAGDEKVNVRKAALQALENIIKLESDGYNKENLKVLHDRTMDPALSVRKQAMTSLTEILLEMPHDKEIMKAWLDGVFPLVMDRETSASEKCLEIIDEVIISNIVPYQRSKDGCHKMVWRLLDEVAGNDGTDLRRFLNKAFCQWGRAGRLKVSLIGYLQTHIGTENNAGVWMVLAEMAPFVPKLNHNFIVDYWRNHACTAPESEFHVVNKVLTVLGFVAKNIPDSDIEIISKELRDRLMKFDSPPELVSATLTTLHKLCKAESDHKAAQKRHNTWIVDLLRTCDSYLSDIILSDGNDITSDEDRIVKHLFTLGEVAQLCPAQIPKRVFMLVQSLIASPVIVGDASSQEYPYPQTQLQTQNPTPDQTQENGNSSPENADKQSADKDSPSGESQPSHSAQNSQQVFPQGGLSQGALSQFRGSRMSSKVRAHAFITLGKLCLQHEDVAKKCVAALARELEVSSDPIIRNNVVIIMADLCVRYTTLVDHYVSNISSCLRDDAPLVRKQTLTLLTHLLQEDFLKWKGSLFYRFVSTINDEDKDISSFAEFCLAHLLVQRHPTMFFQHFVECVFHFNSYEDHNVYNKFNQTDREKKMFSLKGRNNFEKRMKIYRFMLEHMTDEHKFNLSAKLTNDVLGAIVDGVIPLDSETSALLQDTLTTLCCKEIKLSTMKSKPQEEIAENEQEMAAAVINAAKKTLISQVVKRNVIENIVPIVISLKHLLEKQRSPVLRDLMIYLRELMKDYKSEVKDIMSADRQLANEIEFDLRKFEEQQEEMERQRLEQQRRRSRGVPLNIAGASPFGSPVGPGGKSPARPGTPRAGAAGPGTPKATPGTPSAPNGNVSLVGTPQHAQKTPRGRTVRSMSTMAILNSARKAMEQAKRVSMSARNSPDTNKDARGSLATPRRNSDDGSVRTSSTGSTPSPHRSKKVGWADDVSDNQEESSQEGNTFKTPSRKTGKLSSPEKRAISTPYGNTSNPNITFVPNDSNMSMLPPSPIPSAIPMRLYPDNSRKSGSKSPAQDANRATNLNVIHMFSPDKPTPKPRTWNVKSPAPRPKRPGPPSFSSSEDEGEDDKEENAPPSEGNQKKKTSKNTSRTSAAEPLKASRKSTEAAENVVDSAANRKKEHDKINESLAKGTRKTRGSLAREDNPDDSITNRSRGSVSEGGNPNDSIASRTRRSKEATTPSETANQSRPRRSSSRKK